MQIQIKKNIRLIIALLFSGFVLSYLVCRAFYSEFISDETASYWYFVYRGWFWGDQVVWDAANHPLNSYIGYHLYNLFGDIPGILRSGSLISYIFYAFATYKFTGLLNRKSLQILAFIALNSIPYMLEYFAYLRGYGLSMGFFMCGLWYLYKFANEQKIKYVIIIYFFSFISFSANLTLLNSVILTIIAVVFVSFIHRKKFNWKQSAIIILASLLLIISCLPLIDFALKLKASGALYYSSLDGIWDMTGKSLSRYIFFTDSDILMPIFLVVFILFLVILWREFKKLGWDKLLLSSNTWIAYFFFGNLAAVILMAFLLKIHYPEDRTGMYFIPLFFLLIFYLMQQVKYTEWLLLFFPITLFFHLSIHSSVFTPEERITEVFYQKVQNELKDDDVVSIYKTMYANWQYRDSHQNKMIHFPHTSMRKGNEADVFITRSKVQAVDSFMNPYLATEYEIFAKDATNDHVAYRRKQTRKETLFYELDTTQLESSGEFLELFNRNSFFTNQQDVKLVFKFHLSIEDLRQSTDFVVTTSDEKGESVRYLAMALELNFQSKKLDNDLNFAVMLDNLQQNEKGIKVYLWNRKKNVMHKVSNLQIKMFDVKD